MAKAGKNGWDRCFNGIIKRTTDVNGNPVVYGRVRVHTQIIQTKAKDQWELGEKLDEMVLMVLNGKDVHCEECDDIFMN